MLSDTCFQLIDDILTAVVDYDYSDDYKDKLIRTIMKLNEIRDSLDKCGSEILLKNDKKESKRVATKMYENAQKRREIFSADFYDDIY